jgi:hypothetical protein
MSWYFICSIVRAERRLFVDNLRIHVIVDHRYLNFHNMESFYPLLFTMMWFMVFNATFNNISVISWWSVLLVEEIGVPAENHRHAASH